MEPTPAGFTGPILGATTLALLATFVFIPAKLDHPRLKHLGLSVIATAILTGAGPMAAAAAFGAGTAVIVFTFEFMTTIPVPKHLITGVANEALMVFYGRQDTWVVIAAHTALAVVTALMGTYLHHWLARNTGRRRVHGELEKDLQIRTGTQPGLDPAAGPSRRR